ncbi:MAG TPA: EAL domain-containing protein [Thermoanaerobaculia bacterium]
MRRRLFGAGVLLAVLVAVALPIAISIWMAHQRSMDLEVRHLSEVASDVLQRVDAMAQQATAAYDRLEAEAPDEPCSEAGLELLRSIVIASSRVQLVGHVRDERLLCSSLGLHGGGLALGAPAWVNTRGVAFRPATQIQPGAATFLALQKGSWIAAVETERLIEVFSDRPELSVGAFTIASAHPIIHRGAFNENWPRRLGASSERTLFDRQHLVVMKRSTSFEAAAYAALPVDYLKGRIYSQALVLLPIGIAVGALLAFGIFRFLHRQASFPARLRTALRRHALQVEYQPIVDLHSGAIVGAEALLRWPSLPEPLGRPDRIVRSAEECGLIQQVTAYVIARVAADAPRIVAHSPDLYISINLSAGDLHDGGVVEHLRRLVSDSHLMPSNVVVEATEHSFVNPELARDTIRAIRELGIRVGIDDFGTGFSSLSHLAKLPLDLLKIDRSFVETIGTDSPTSEVAMHILRIASSLSLQVIAEGVERQEQVAFLQQHGVALAQGWLFHRSLPLDALLELLADQPDVGKAEHQAG